VYRHLTRISFTFMCDSLSNTTMLTLFPQTLTL